MEWVIVFLGVLIAFGGIVYVLPSQRERLRGKTRLKARRIGLVVSSATLANRDAPSDEKVTAGGKRKNPVRLGFAYSKNYVEHKGNFPSWQMIPHANSTQPFAGWEIQSDELRDVRHVDNEYWQAIEGLCKSAPRRCYGIRCDEYGVAWIGVEDLQHGDVDEFLNEVVEFLDRFAALNVDYVASQIGLED